SRITEQAWVGPEATRRIILTYPLAVTYGQYPMQDGNISALVLAFVPLLLLGSRSRQLRESPIVQLSTAALSGIVLWVMLRPSVLAPRYFMASLLAFVPLAMSGSELVLGREGKTSSWLRRGVLLCALVVVLSSLGVISGKVVDAVTYISGRASDCDFE